MNKERVDPTGLNQTVAKTRIVQDALRNGKPVCVGEGMELIALDQVYLRVAQADDDEATVFPLDIDIDSTPELATWSSLADTSEIQNMEAGIRFEQMKGALEKNQEHKDDACEILSDDVHIMGRPIRTIEIQTESGETLDQLNADHRAAPYTQPDARKADDSRLNLRPKGMDTP